MNNVPHRDGRPLEKPRVVEIIGPAGAGKTTLYQAIDCPSAPIRLGNFPDVRKMADAPFFVLNGLQLIPSLLGLYRPSARHLTRREFAWMTILYGWSALLCKKSKDDKKVIVLDQGPVYLLAEMREFGPEYLRQQPAERLWQELFRRWAAALDMVVWLDAADEVLLERIRTRRQEHIVKEEPATIVYEFLDRYRTEYEFILSVLKTKKAGLKILRFDTERQQPQDIMDQCLTELGYGMNVR